MSTDNLAQQIRDAVLSELIIGRAQIEEAGTPFYEHGLFMKIEGKNSYTQFQQYQFICLVAEYPGGAWQQFATGEIFEDFVKIKVKTIFGIMARKFIDEEYTFIACKPGFPDNITTFLKEAARNAKHAFRLSHKRSWIRHNRDMRKKRRIRNPQPTNPPQPGFHNGAESSGPSTIRAI